MVRHAVLAGNWEVTVAFSFNSEHSLYISSRVKWEDDFEWRNIVKKSV
jgi:hypothetical protein